MRNLMVAAIGKKQTTRLMYGLTRHSKYLQKKKNKAAKDLDKHVWTDGDDLWKLSQRYAVRLSSLKKLNKGVTSFVEGDLVCLR